MRLQKVLTGAGHLLFLLFVFPFPVYENSREAASYVLMLPYFDRKLLFPFQYDQGYWTLRQIHETCPGSGKLGIGLTCGGHQNDTF